MNQEFARTLLIEGATFIFLGGPEEIQFGIDMQCWHTKENFRGIKMIPPGLHYIHYSTINKTTGDVSPRSGFMHYFHKKEFLVKIWDKKIEDMSQDEVNEEKLLQLKQNLLKLDRYLAPYPYKFWAKWKLLTSHITAHVASKLSPENGMIRESLELLSITDEERPRGVKSTSKDVKAKEEIVPESSNKSNVASYSVSDPTTTRVTRMTRRDKEDSLLPDLKPVPGTSLRFTEISKTKYPPGSTLAEITRHYLDQSYTLQLLVTQNDEPLHVIGELQFAYLCFLIGHSLEAFEHWKNLVILLCSCEKAILKYRDIYFYFVKTIEIQINEMPKDFLADIVMNKNIVYKKLRDFFRTAIVSKVDPRLLSMFKNLKSNLTASLQWDFTGLESDEEDEKPVIVQLDNF